MSHNESEVTSFIVRPTNNLLSNFEDASIWTSLSDSMDTGVEDPTILFDQFYLPTYNYLVLAAGVAAGTSSIVSDGFFNPEYLIGPASTLAVILASSTKCSAKLYAKGNNWVTGSSEDQLAYRSELAGVIAALTILEVPVRHWDIREGAVTIALDGDSALI